MIRLRSFGQCVVETDSGRIVPDAGVLFAVALYLLMERHRSVNRDELEQLLWPTTDERKRGHCLRQAVYRLKALGLSISPPNGDRAHIAVEGASDVDALTVGTARGEEDVEALAEIVVGGFLPGYAPAFSERFTEWLERRRDIANSAARRVLVAAIAARRTRHEWGDVETLAKHCLAIDPLNEEATLSLAEAAAMHGSKSFALTVLDRYLKEIGPDAREIRLPATLLKRRISESRPMERPLYVGQTPFVGREEEFGTLNRALDAAMTGEGSAHLVWGEPGIGKTRLVMEFAKAAEFRGARVVKTKCQSHDESRTMSLFVDMVPQLLGMPGALGCAPETMQYLKRLTDHRPPDDGLAEPSDPELRAASLRRAIADLLDAVSSEGPLLL
ncbi:MAG: AAA family ATPase, partial [Gemmatimonadota bacterium]|nr:AAA family ATPase [Gemmatimonadota bacterium]